MQKFRLFFFSFLSFSFFLSAQIIEIDKLHQVYPYVKKNALVIFDIDNTLLEPAQELGSDQWFDKRLIFYKKEGIGSKEAFEKTLDEYYQIQSVTDVQLVEKETADIVRKISKENKVMALTTRSCCLSFATARQFKKLNLVLENPPFLKETYLYTDRGLLYKDGFFFTEGANKGQAFLAFLAKTKLNPQAVVFVNDKQKPLEEMEEACAQKKIAFIGLRYGFLDRKVKKVDQALFQKKPVPFSKLLLEVSQAR